MLESSQDSYYSIESDRKRSADAIIMKIIDDLCLGCTPGVTLMGKRSNELIQPEIPRAGRLGVAID